MQCIGVGTIMATPPAKIPKMSDTGMEQIEVVAAATSGTYNLLYSQAIQ